MVNKYSGLIIKIQNKYGIFEIIKIPYLTNPEKINGYIKRQGVTSNISKLLDKSVDLKFEITIQKAIAEFNENGELLDDFGERVAEYNGVKYRPVLSFPETSQAIDLSYLNSFRKSKNIKDKEYYKRQLLRESNFIYATYAMYRMMFFSSRKGFRRDLYVLLISAIQRKIFTIAEVYLYVFKNKLLSFFDPVLLLKILYDDKISSKSFDSIAQEIKNIISNILSQNILVYYYDNNPLFWNYLEDVKDIKNISSNREVTGVFIQKDVFDIEKSKALAVKWIEYQSKIKGGKNV